VYSKYGECLFGSKKNDRVTQGNDIFSQNKKEGVHRNDTPSKIQRSQSTRIQKYQAPKIQEPNYCGATPEADP
jgi:hypothetical protein